jgi:y4mF family transcriptional regulator
MSRTAKEGVIVTDAKAFGRILRQRRKELGYTQSYIAEFSGFSVSFISDLENGKRTAELDKSIRLANILGLDCELKPRDEK